MPIMLALLLGAVDMGRLFYTYISVQNAAREGAAYAAFHPGCPSNTGAECADPNNSTYVARQEMGGDTGLGVAVSCTVACVATTGPTGNTVTVTATGTFMFLFPGLDGEGLNLSASTTAVIQ
jgi:Flp pilus assembly protein TadG